MQFIAKDENVLVVLKKVSKKVQTKNSVIEKKFKRKRLTGYEKFIITKLFDNILHEYFNENESFALSFKHKSKNDVTFTFILLL